VDSAASSYTPPRILVINPNSSETMTRAMDAPLDILRRSGAYRVDSIRLPDAPAGIESQADIETVVPMIAARVREDDADAYVIACYSDPGLALAREISKKPIFGIAESSMIVATDIGRKFGIVSILDKSIPRHLRYVRAMGLESRLANDRAINSGVAGLEAHGALDKVIDVGRQLRDEDGADVLILGCAGMGHFRGKIEAALGIPVVDPTQAAVSRAMNLLALGYRPGH
jgi:Asp/Glu/hydantoin racemase